MSRPLRIEYPGAWYHTMNRGRWSEALFLSDADREEFLKVLRESAEQWNLQVAAYCLMSNHYHLLVQTPDGNLARAMRHLNGIYTQRFNRSHKKEGQLFRGRYKAVLIEEDSHLLEVLRYIHRNPLRAGVVKNLDDYQWSSHKGYLSRASCWAWLQRDELLTMLTAVKSRQRYGYRRFVSETEPEEIEKFYSLKNLPSILGSTSFVERIRETYFDLNDTVEVPEAKILAPDPEKVLTAVCRHYHISLEQLMASRRGNENLPRDVAIYLVRNLCRLTLPEVGQVFGIGNYSSVSSAVQRMKGRSQGNARLRKQLEEIKKNALEGQKRT